MFGPGILVRTLSVPAETGKSGARWQYHSRGDRHSKAACWGIVFDLLLHSKILARHAAEGKIGFGINHEMRDFENDRKKNLDLVLCTPASGRVARNARTLRSYAKEKGIVLSEEEQRLLDDLPELLETPVGSVEIALEAKAVMTAHVKALPRLYDELNSSQLTIHGASDLAIAVGLVVVNVSESFVNTQGTTNAGKPWRRSASRMSGVTTRPLGRRMAGADGMPIVEPPLRVGTQSIPVPSPRIPSVQ